MFNYIFASCPLMHSNKYREKLISLDSVVMLFFFFSSERENGRTKNKDENSSISNIPRAHVRSILESYLFSERERETETTQTCLETAVDLRL